VSDIAFSSAELSTLAGVPVQKVRIRHQRGLFRARALGPGRNPRPRWGWDDALALSLVSLLAEEVGSPVPFASCPSLTELVAAVRAGRAADLQDAVLVLYDDAPASSPGAWSSLFFEGNVQDWGRPVREEIHVAQLLERARAQLLHRLPFVLAARGSQVEKPRVTVAATAEAPA